MPQRWASAFETSVLLGIQGQIVGFIAGDVEFLLQLARDFLGAFAISGKFAGAGGGVSGGADWLSQGGCQMVAMESTASYWKPLYNILESSIVPAMVVNAKHVKAVPGRKTDIKDAEWIDLLQHGLPQASHIPDKDQRELRSIATAKALSASATRELTGCW